MADNDDLISRLVVAFWGSDVKRNAVHLAMQTLEIVEPVIRAQIADEKKDEKKEAPVEDVLKVVPQYVTVDEVEAMIATAMIYARAEFGSMLRGTTAYQRHELLAALRASVATLWQENHKIIGLYRGGDVPAAMVATGAIEALQAVLDLIDGMSKEDGQP